MHGKSAIKILLNRVDWHSILLGLTGLRNEVCGKGSLPIAADVQRE